MEALARMIEALVQRIGSVLNLVLGGSQCELIEFGRDSRPSFSSILATASHPEPSANAPTHFPPEGLSYSSALRCW